MPAPDTLSLREKRSGTRLETKTCGFRLTSPRTDVFQGSCAGMVLPSGWDKVASYF